MSTREQEDQLIEELTMLLLYLTSWQEKVAGEWTIQRAWKGFRFEVLDALEESGHINQSRRAKSVTLTDDGIRQAQALKDKYLERLS